MLSKFTNLFFPICSLMISILIFILFFCKKKLKNEETKAYSKLVLLGLAESTLYTFICLISHFWLKDNTIQFFILLNKLLYIIYIIWFTTLFYYLINLYNVKNRKIIERVSEEKSIFLFKMSQELKEPVKKISDEVKIYKNESPNKKEVDTIISNIEGNNNKIKYMINDATGISSNDNRNLRIIENTYNPYSLISEVEIKTKKLLNKNICLKFSCDSNIPTELYGDAIKLKQVLISIISNSIKNTDKGYIKY